MYGFIAFLIWGGIYALLPQITGRAPSRFLVGTHFWLAIIGLAVYSIPLMIGGTMQGFSWISGAPFIESVITMMPFWVWRAVGGSLMFISHVVFAYNVWQMRPAAETVELTGPAAAQARVTA